MKEAPFKEEVPNDRNKTILLCVLGALIVLVLSVVLISNSCAGGNVGETPETVGSEQNLTDTASATEDGTAPEQSEETGTAGTAQTTEPPFSVEQTVSDNRDEFDSPGRSEQTATPDSGETTPTTQPSTEATVPSTTPSGPALISYAAWLELTPKQQSEYFHQFAEPMDYINWLENAKKEYEEDRNEVVATGDVDLGKLP